MCELVKLLFIISVVCSKFYAINRNFTRPPVPPVPTNMMSGDGDDGDDGDGGDADSGEETKL